MRQHLNTINLSLIFWFQGYVCDWLAGARWAWQSSAPTGEVFQEHPGTIPGTWAIIWQQGGNGSLYAKFAHHTSSQRCGVNRQMGLGQSTSSLGWGDSCRQHCLVTADSGQPQWKNKEQNRWQENYFFFFLSWCQSSKRVPGLLPALAQQHIRALYPWS